MKTPSRILVATLAVAIALPALVFAAKADRKNKNEDAGPSFTTVDKSSDGTVSQEEYVNAMKDKLGEEGAKSRFTTLDKDGNGKLSKEEFDAGAATAKKKRKKKDS